MSARTRTVGALAISFAGGLAFASAASGGGAPSFFEVDSVADEIDDNTADGQCHTATGKCTLRAAVMQANVMTSTSTIVLPAGTYLPDLEPTGGDGDDSGDLNLTTGADVINIYGAGAATTIIDADLIVDRVMRVHSGRTANISGVTLRNGHSVSGYGGGIWNQGILTVSYSTLGDNTAGGGGGIQSEVALTLSHSTLSGNHAQLGGSVLTFGTLDISQCTISGNEAMQHGGGVGNGGTLFVTNSTISGNGSYDNGGGIYNYATGIANVYSSTIAFNWANADADFDATSGGGVFNSNGATFNLRSSVVAGNSVFGGTVENDCVGTLGSYGRNKFGTEAGCTVGQFGLGDHTLLGSLSELGPLRFNGGSARPHALLAPSDMIDGAEKTFGCTDSNGSDIATDQRGGTRGLDTLCDISAFEFGALPADLLFADGFELGNLWGWG